MKRLVSLFALVTAIAALSGCSGGNVESSDVKAWQSSEDDKKAGIDSSKIEGGQPDR